MLDMKMVYNSLYNSHQFPDDDNQTLGCTDRWSGTSQSPPRAHLLSQLSCILTRWKVHCVRFRGYVKSGSTPEGGPVKSGRRQTKKEGRGLDKRLVRPELVTAWIQRLRTTSVDPLRRFRSRRGDRDRDRDGQDQE